WRRRAPADTRRSRAGRRAFLTSSGPVREIIFHPRDRVELTRIQVGIRNLNREFLFNSAHQIGEHERIEQAALKQRRLRAAGKRLVSNLLYNAAKALTRFSHRSSPETAHNGTPRRRF